MSRDWANFFDPSKARGPRSAPDVGDASPADAGGDTPDGAMSVAALVARVKQALARAFEKRVAVVGEISNFKRHGSGHLYFRLKDADAAIDAVMFRSAAGKVKFQPEDGLEVVAEGRVDVYEVRGQLQFYVERLTPRGAGALELAFRQLEAKLRAEGLFDPSAKKPIPRFPRAVGVVTSRTGAALRDIRRTLSRRWPAARVYLVPSLVQGEQAGRDVARAIGLLDASAERYEIDTIIVSRGGGSLEDLWAFNEEVVARAIFAARTPIISGVGHEVDVTIADLVADQRAATPTAAAELAVPEAAETTRYLQALQERMSRGVSERLRSSRLSLDGICRSVVFRDPSARLRTHMQHVDELSHRLGASLRDRLSRPRRRLERAANALAAVHPARLHEHCAASLARVAHRLAWALGGRSKRAGEALSAVEGRLRAAHPKYRLRLARQRVDSLARQLESMSYRSVLGRGFSVTRGPDGQIVRSTGAVSAGDALRTELSDGQIDSRVIAARRADGVQGPAPKMPPAAPARRRPTASGPSLFDEPTEESPPSPTDRSHGKTENQL
jgi:exodeoxyribonuclease VII large subunit